MGNGLMGCPDNYSQWKNHERQQEAWLARRPVCYECGEHIQNEDCWELNGELICTDCLETNHKKHTEDYIE